MPSMTTYKYKTSRNLSYWSAKFGAISRQPESSAQPGQLVPTLFSFQVAAVPLGSQWSCLKGGSSLLPEEVYQ